MLDTGGRLVQLKKLLEKWDLTSLRNRTPFLEMDRTAGWELYVELSTQVSTHYTRLVNDLAEVEDLIDLEAF